MARSDVEIRLDVVEGIRRRRDDLYATLVRFEEALASPAAPEEAWLRRIEEATEALRRTLVAHIQEVEAPDGLFAEVVDDSPRLAHLVEVLRREHVQLRQSVSEFVAFCIDVPRPLTEDGRAALRSEGLSLFAALARHRHRGADLVYEAFNVDVGTGD